MIAPSILNADNMHLSRDIKAAIESGIERFHIDIMMAILFLIYPMDQNW